MNLAEGILERHDYIEQSGVKGMRWGFSKARENRMDRKASATPDATTAKALKKQVRKKGLDSLSNEQLQALNKRIELESKYNKWSEKNPTMQKKAATFIAKTMIQEAQHEILGLGDGSPLGQFVRTAKPAVQKARNVPPPKHKGPSKPFIQMPQAQKKGKKGKNKP
jgi:hypothetical protein